MVLEFLKGKYGFQLWTFFLLSLFSWIIFQAIGLVVLSLTTSFSISELMNIMNLSNLPDGTSGYFVFFIMLFFQSLGLFVLPALFFPIFINVPLKGYFSFKVSNELSLLVLLPFFAISGLIIVSFLGEWNMKIEMPKYFHDMEKSASDTVDYLLSFKEIPYVLLTTFLMAILPAIGEELFFRGIVQQILIKWSKKNWLGILITAFVFSAIHFQFLTFLPRFFMGIVLGYLFIWTKNILFPIIAHFLHNFISILTAYSVVEQDLSKIKSLNIVVGLIAVITFFVVCYIFISSSKKNHVS